MVSNITFWFAFRRFLRSYYVFMIFFSPKDYLCKLYGFKTANLADMKNSCALRPLPIFLFRKNCRYLKGRSEQSWEQSCGSIEHIYFVGAYLFVSDLSIYCRYTQG